MRGGRHTVGVRSLFMCFVLAPLLMAPSCGFEDSAIKQRGEPCARDSECNSGLGLTCEGGICDRAADGGFPDGGSCDASRCGDGGSVDGSATDGGAIDGSAIDGGARCDAGPCDGSTEADGGFVCEAGSCDASLDGFCEGGPCADADSET